MNLKRPLEPGERFGWLTVIAPLEERLRNGVGYLCLCRCGAEVKVAVGHLLGHQRRTCGAMTCRSEQRKEQHALSNEVDAPSWWQP